MGPNSQAYLPPAGLSPKHGNRAEAPITLSANPNFFINDYTASGPDKSKRRVIYGHDPPRRQSAEADADQKLPEITASHSSQGRRKLRAIEEN